MAKLFVFVFVSFRVYTQAVLCYRLRLGIPSCILCFVTTVERGNFWALLSNCIFLSTPFMAFLYSSPAPCGTCKILVPDEGLGERIEYIDRCFEHRQALSCQPIISEAQRAKFGRTRFCGSCTTWKHHSLQSKQLSWVF